ARHHALLRLHLLPQLDPLPITEIDTVTVLSVLREIEARGTIETAHQVRRTAEMVFRFGINSGLLLANPARDLGDALKPRPETQHYAALKLEEVGPMLNALTQSRAHPVTKAALRLMLLTGLRDFSLRHARWRDIDLDNGVWTIPATAMKGRKKAFITPLPKQASELLRKLRPLTYDDEDSFVFASSTGRKGMMSGGLLATKLHELGFAATAHGLRSLITDFLYESGFRAEAIESQLGHRWGEISRQRDEGNRRGNEVRMAYL